MTITAGTEIVELDTGVYARLHPGLTNAGIIVGEKGVLIIDSLRTPSFARDLIKDVQSITRKPIRYVIDTHAHWDHAWGNEEFPDAIIIGHENCLEEMLDVEWNEDWRETLIASNEPWAAEAKLVQITPPNHTFETSMHLYFGDRQISLKYFGKAHTSGDIFIYLPKEKLVFTGDVAQYAGVPYFGDSYPKEWPGTSGLLVELPVERFVSGHGPIGDHDDLEESRHFIEKLVAHIQTAIQEDQDVETTSESVTTKLYPQFSEWRGFDHIVKSIPGLYKKLKA